MCVHTHMEHHCEIVWFESYIIICMVYPLGLGLMVEDNPLNFYVIVLFASHKLLIVITIIKQIRNHSCTHTYTHLELSSLFEHGIIADVSHE